MAVWYSILVKMVLLFIGNPSQSYGTSRAVWDHTVLPATQHRWTCPTL